MEDNPIIGTIRSIIGFLITPFALLVFYASEIIQSVTGLDGGYSYAIAFLSPITAVILFYSIRSIRRMCNGDN